MSEQLLWPTKPRISHFFSCVLHTYTDKRNVLITLFLNQYIYTPYRYEYSENVNYLLGVLLYLYHLMIVREL